MVKYLLLGLIVYVYYRFFLAPKKIAPKDQDMQYREPDDDDEYVDYEEVD